MKISYLMNSFIFLEVYNTVKNGEVKIDEIKINSILKYLKNEEKEKVYENIRSLTAEIEKIKIDNLNLDNIFKGVTARQVGVYPVESFNIEVSENIDVPVDVIEKIKSATFLCCSNISLIINRNSLEIEREIENIMTYVRKFTLEEAEEKIVDIMIRDDENTENDLMLSVNVNKLILEKITDEIDPSLFSSEVIDIIDELSDCMKNDVISLLIDDECILRIVKEDNVVDFKYNTAILNELPDEKKESIRNKCKNLVMILTNN